MSKVAFITGVTGFIGGELARHIYQGNEFVKVYLLIRPVAGLSVDDRLLKIKEVWKAIHGLATKEDFFHIIIGDISDFNSYLIPGDVTHIFHSAASTRFDDSLSFARKLNLIATQNLLIKARNLSKLQLFVQVSTAFVSGNLLGLIKESDKPTDFLNAYEKSKFEAEQSVRHSGLPFIIVRPSIVVGDSQTGYTQHYRVFYSMLRVWLHGKIPRAPLHRQACVDIVPVDFVCRGILALTNSANAHNDTYHLCAGPKQLVDPISILNFAVAVFGIRRPPISPVWVVYFLNHPIVRKLIPRTLREYLSTMEGHFPYMSPRKRAYDMSKAMKILGKEGVECPRLSDYGEVMFLYCKQSNWGRNLKGLDYVRS